LPFFPLFFPALQVAAARPAGYAGSPLWPLWRAVLRDEADPDMSRIPFRDENCFRAGSLREAVDFWRDEILVGAPVATRNLVLSVLQEGFDFRKYFCEFDADAAAWVAGPPPPPTTSARDVNRVPPEFEGFVDQQIAAYLASGALLAVDERPYLLLPLSIEPDKPRLIVDSRPMNRYTKAMPFVMGSVGLVPAMVPERALFSSVDHKSGYHHVWVHPECWQFQGVFWKGQYYVFCVLVFGYCLSPWF
jgi:hypothetical protein